MDSQYQFRLRCLPGRPQGSPLPRSGTDTRRSWVGASLAVALERLEVPQRPQIEYQKFAAPAYSYDGALGNFCQEIGEIGMFDFWQLWHSSFTSICWTLV